MQIRATQNLALNPDMQLNARFASLRWLLHGLAGREVTAVIGPARGSGARAAPHRPVLDAGRLLLPQDLGAGSVDCDAIFRAAIAHAVAHLRFSVPARALEKLKPMSVAVISAVEDARVERLLAHELPGVRAWFARAIALSSQEEALSFSGLMSRLDRALADPDFIDGNFWVEKARELFEAQAATDLHDYCAFRRIASVLANDLGQLRVPFRAQQYTVPAAYRDDNTYLWQLADPPEPPVAVSFTSIAPRDPDGAAAPAQAQPAASGVETELGRYCYPEWDERAGLMRDDWATVIEKRPAWSEAQPLQMQERSSVNRAVWRVPMRLARSQRRREFEGEHLDLNAAIDSMVAIRTGRVPDARLFLSAQFARVGSSVLVLLDLSESTNDKAISSVQSLLDLERNAALLLARSSLLNRTGDRIAIHGFHSDGREEVSYYRMLDFGKPLDFAAQAMVSQAPGRFSTRLGAAMRHAGHCLGAEAMEQRALLVVTDGAPSDIDVHAPSYLIEDARSAVQGVRRAGIRVHALAVDPTADRYVSRIFGARGYDIVERPASLPAKLRHAYDLLGA